MFKGFDKLHSLCFFKLSSTELRGNSLKLYKSRARLIGIEKNIFSNWVVNEWNRLDEDVIVSCTVSTFKRKLIFFI